MNRSVATSFQLPLILVLGLLLTAIAGAAFYGWVRFGSSIFLAMAENGLSWCL